MKDLVKDGDIILDGTASRQQKEMEAFEKLEELEGFEKELGIGLSTLLRALKYGVYYYTYNQLTRDYVSLISNYVDMGFHEKLSYSFITGFEKKILPFQDYKKTWALTKEELLNGNN